MNSRAWILVPVKRTFNNAVDDQLGRIGKALASPRRLELLDPTEGTP